MLRINLLTDEVEFEFGSSKCLDGERSCLTWSKGGDNQDVGRIIQQRRVQP